MIALVRRKLTFSISKNTSSSVYKSPVSFSLYLHFFSTSSSRLISPETFDILLHKHDFSPEVASRVASYAIHPGKADSILSFLKESGLSTAQLEKLVKGRPQLLLASLAVSIKPKIKIFQDLGFSSDAIAKIITYNPAYLHSSLRKNVVPNVEFLKSCGIHMERILALLYTNGRCLAIKLEFSRKSVDKAEEIGLNRSSKMFIYAFGAIATTNSNTWELKWQAFRDLGFSENDIRTMFRKMPLLFWKSMEKVKKTKEILLATGKFSISCMVKNPMSLACSIEKKYKPRLRILVILESRNLIKNWPALGTLCRMSDDKFFKTFISPYFNDVDGVYITKSLWKKED